MRIHNPFLWILIIGATAMFVLGIVFSVLLGLVPERTFARSPVATISLDLSGQVRSLQAERSRVNAALVERDQRIGALERELGGKRQDEALASVVSPLSTAGLDVDLQKARQKIAALTEAMDKLRGDRDAARQESAASLKTAASLRRNLAGLVAEHDRLQRDIGAENVWLREALDRKETEVALLRKSVEDSRSHAPQVAQTSPVSVSAPVAPPPTETKPAPDTPRAAVSGSSLYDGVAAYQAGNYADAFRIWEPLAEKGNARAQFHLGALYFEGRGVVRDLNEARTWLRRAAEKGSAPARSLLPRVEDDLRLREKPGGTGPAAGR